MIGPSFPSAPVRRLVMVLLASALAGVLSGGRPTQVSAQEAGFATDRLAGTAFDLQRSLYFWMNYTDGDSYGGANQHMRLGGTKYITLDSGALLFTGQALVTDRGNGGASAGVVRRWLVRNEFLGDVVFGAGAHWDLTQSAYDHDYHQIVGSLELLTENWGLRLTGYGPVGETVNTLRSTRVYGASDVPFFQGHYLLANGNIYRTDEVALGGIEIELAHSVGNLFGSAVDNDAAEVFVGYYNLQGAVGRQGHGVKGGLRGYVLPSVAASVTVAGDGLFGTGVYGGFTWFFGGSGGNLPGSIADKLTTPVIRNHQVAIGEAQTILDGGSAPLTQGGQPITFMHVNDAGAAGDGTFENPHGSLTAANSDPDKGHRDVVYVYSDTSFGDQTYTLTDNQRLLGEGDHHPHFVPTDQLGPIHLPAVHGLAGARPLIRFTPNTVGGAINVANGTEVSNFAIHDSGAGIFAGGITGEVNVNRTIIRGGGNGIDVIGGSGTITLTDVAVIDPLGVGMYINGGSSTIHFGGPHVPIDGLFGPSFLTQTSGSGPVQVEGGHTGVLNQNPGSSISSDGLYGLRFDRADGTYNFHGTVTVNGGLQGIGIGNSDGDFTFADAAISGLTGSAVSIWNSSASMTYNGHITHANGSRIVSIIGHQNAPGESITFQNGTLHATGGGGLFFFGARGNYNFDGAVILDDTFVGIDIRSRSTGTFNFANTTISNPSGRALRIVGIADTSQAVVNFTGGSITQTYDRLTAEISNHAGTVRVDVPIYATDGRGLQFANADGTYLFSGPTTLTGGDAGIYIYADSDGSFTFDGRTSIATATGLPVLISGGTVDQDAQVRFNALDIQQSAGPGVWAVNSGSLTIDSGNIANTVGDGIRVSNTNLAVDFTNIGVGGGIGDDGIEVVNSDGTDRTATITNNNLFGLGASSGIANRGIYINSNGTGTLEANVTTNRIESANQTVLTNDGGTPGSLILDLIGNSTLTTHNAGVPAMEFVGLGLDSTIVRRWDGPNQVVGDAPPFGTGGGGILFDRISFDADANPGNGYQQVGFTGTLTIGQPPPMSISRVTGDGLSLINPTGSLSIHTLNIANFNGTGLEVDTKGLGTTFHLATGGGTIDTLGGPATVLDPPVPAAPLEVDLTFENLRSVDSPQAGMIMDNVAGEIHVTGTTTLLNWVGEPVTSRNSAGLNLDPGTLITK